MIELSSRETQNIVGIVSAQLGPGLWGSLWLLFLFLTAGQEFQAVCIYRKLQGALWKESDTLTSILRSQENFLLPHSSLLSNTGC